MRRLLAILLPIVVILGACESEDRTKPVIVLTNPDYKVPLGGIYVEQGALATDKEDGVLDSAGLIIDNSAVNTAVVGDYEVSYFITDAAGNEDSVTRTVGVYARSSDYSGNWAVRDSCDSLITNYSVEIVASMDDSTALTVSNWRDRGATEIVDVSVFGRLGRAISVGDTLDVYTYIGSGLLETGTLTDFIFELDWSEEDSTQTVFCFSTFTKM